jgi:FKBP-type peptidyl-prolyl cis-trans isomerase SlyD
LKQIAPSTVVSLEIEIHDTQGERIHSSDVPLSYLHGGYGGIFEVLEQALDGKQAGDVVRVQLEPEEAFGEYDADLLHVEPRSRYGDGLEAGMEVEDAFDEEEPRMYIVTDLAGDKAVLDGNHPLAGIALRFTCTVLAVRDATEEELERGAVDDDADDEADD